ncbi:MAG: hypothetical protein HUU35_14420 [Armatimonadetes bacterium]|nr:hypothetical protein [Armatimonadota bacterium]
MRRNVLLWLACLALTAPVAAQREVVAMRQNNTAALSLRGAERALVVRDRGLVTDPDRQSALLLFCRQKGVTALFLASYELPPRNRLNAEIAYGWRSLLRRAHQQGMDVYALTGDSSWINDSGRALAQIDAVASLAQSGAPGEGFDGILFDFPLISQLQKLFPVPERLKPPAETEYETGGLPPAPAPLPAEREAELPEEERTYRDDANEVYRVGSDYEVEQLPTTAVENQQLLRQYIESVDRLRGYLAGRHAALRLRLGMTIPAWLRTPVLWRGELKYASDHFVDLTDFVMAHNYPGETVDIVRAADGVIKYAGRSGKAVFARVELSFPLRPMPELLTLFSRDELFLESLVRELIDRHGNTPGFAGVALDDYQSYRVLPAVRALPELYQPTRRELLRPSDRR